jgi:penicillin-binding protein 2
MSFHPNDVVRRARAATFVVCGVGVYLAAAFFRTQILHHDELVMQSEDNRLRQVPIPAPRGIIVDRNGEIIAENAVSYSVSMLVKNEKELDSTMTRLNELIPMSKKSITDAINRYRRDTARPTAILIDASFDQVAVLEEHRQDYPSLIIQTAPKRVYPLGRAVGAFVGYTSEITEKQLKDRADSGYRGGQQIGNTGLEESYESLLRGREGSRYVEVDAMNRVVRDAGARADLRAIPGKELKTNIDLDLQTFIYNLFGDSLIGGAVALEPKTGAVLAIHTSPSVDPNRFIGGVPRGYYDSLNTDKRRPLYNKALQGFYPPGSTFKLATSVLALESGVATLQTHMPTSCNGTYFFGNRTWHCWEPAGHGSLDLAGAIKHSCDIFFYQLGLKLTLARFSAGGVDLNFGQRTGIDLPSEHRPQWPDPTYLDNKYGKGKWIAVGGPGTFESLNLAIGQGSNSQTILSMARFYAALATDGSEPDSLRVAQRPNQRIKAITLSQDQLVQLRTAMEGVTEAGGTAASAALQGVAIAGKTGTAQSGTFINGKEQNHAWFAGIAPSQDAKIVVVVLIEFGGHGTRAARIASAIIGHYLHVKSVWNLGDQG